MLATRFSLQLQNGITRWRSAPLAGAMVHRIRSMRVLAIGNTVIDTVLTMREVPVDGKVWIDSKKTYVGGQGANAAQGMSIMGLSVSFLTRIGDDEDGAMALRRYKELGMDTQYCIQVPHAQTTSAVVTIATIAQTRACLMLRDESMFAHSISSHLEGINLDHIDVVYTDGHQTEDLVLPVVEKAVSRGLPVVADIEVVDEATRRLAELATDLVAPAAALQELAGKADAGAAALALANRPGKTVIATAGLHGSWGARHGTGQSVHVPAHPECQAVDTVGAGDAFHAGYVAAMSRGIDDLQERMSLATSVAAALCETPGPVVSRAALVRYGILLAQPL